MSGTNVSDRRQFDRIGKSVPIWFGDEAAQEIKARTVNICNGGVLCRVRDDEVPWHVGDFVRTRLNIPRETPNTYFLETIETDCRVIRFEIPRDGDGHLVALAFHPRVDLGMK